jgi:hypothetical protein
MWIVLLLLAIPARADYVYGHVTKLEANRFSIRTRFHPNLDFKVSDQTQCLCRKRRVSFNNVRLGDLVEIDFRTTKDGWKAYRVKITAKEADCSAR